MAFWKFGNSDTVILPGIENEPAANYSFMERGDVVYYRPPGSGNSTMATIESFTRDELGRPDSVVIKTAAGEFIETGIQCISY